MSCFINKSTIDDQFAVRKIQGEELYVVARKRRGICH